jgi:hypothetical protein
VTDLRTVRHRVSLLSSLPGNLKLIQSESVPELSQSSSPNRRALDSSQAEDHQLEQDMDDVLSSQHQLPPSPANLPPVLPPKQHKRVRVSGMFQPVDDEIEDDGP